MAPGVRGMLIPAVQKPRHKAKKFRYSKGFAGIRWDCRKNQPGGKMLKNGQI